MNALVVSVLLFNILTIVKPKINLFHPTIHPFIQHKVRNTVLAFIVFREKKMHKLCNIIKHTLNTYHNKTIVTVADSYYKYNDLSNDDKIIIETIIGLCY